MEHNTYSIIIPAYNEGARLGTTLEKILAHIDQQHWDAEVVVVDDGSTDNTTQVARSYMQTHRHVKLLENPANRGKGFSVRNGMLHARGEILLFTDADLSSPIEEAAKLFAAIENGAEIAIGSRWLKSETQTRKQPFYRQLGGRLFNLTLRTVLGLKYKDTQCGFKAFTYRAANAVFSQQKIERWGFDPELLYLANRFGIQVAEVPVAWAHSAGTRLHPFRDGIRMFADVVKVRENALTGKYSMKLRVT